MMYTLIKLYKLMEYEYRRTCSKEDWGYHGRDCMVVGFTCTSSVSITTDV